MRTGYLLPSLLVLCVAIGCGYTVGTMSVMNDIKVTMFDNSTDRRINELDLTHAVLRELQAHGIRVNSQHAPYELTGTIVSFKQPPIVEGINDQVVVGSLSIELEIVIRNRKTGSVILEDAKTEIVSVQTSRGENIDTAKSEVFAKLAKWVRYRMESMWP